MQPYRITFPAQSNNAIAATQSITATAGGGVILNGSLAPRSNLTPSATTASTVNGSWLPVNLGGIARPVTVFATTSATNCIFTVIGRDLRGNLITATFVGASGAATASSVASLATSTVDFAIVLGVVSSASIGNFTVGTGATGVTNFYQTVPDKTPFQIMVGGTVTATLLTYSVEHTFDNVQTTTSPTVATNGPVVNIATTSFFSGYSATGVPVTAVRGSISGNSATSGGVTFTFIQSG